ncbi:MAG: hypothetical protein G8237_03495 [Magnetococcales bacterium]|nr:SLBB domain-containing protein [Magnetococcales bacterium]NGZ05398.1 hypothetical protein [Magnetococcales bacterium]
MSAYPQRSHPLLSWWSFPTVMLALLGWLFLMPGPLFAEEEAPVDDGGSMPEMLQGVGGQEAEILKQLSPLSPLKGPPGGNLDQMRQRDSKKQSGQTLPPRSSGVSLLEADFSLRAKSSLIQFGYNMFRQAKERTAPVVGSAPDSYILGVGDELLISFRGRSEKNTVAKIDLEGRVLIPTLPEPLIAQGRSFGEFREEVREKIRTTQVGTEVFVSIGAFRFFSVYVMGEVTQPGMHRVTGLSTLLDALSTAGGVRKTGSLRTIQLHRQGQVQTIDLYSLLGKEGSGQDPTLAVGDRIVVPPIGSVVGISGLVKRPGIYELPPEQTNLPLNTLLELAGGPVSPTGNRFSLLKSDARDRETLTEINTAKQATISNGNIVLVEAKLGPNLMGEVALEGHVSRPHTRSLASTPTVRSLLADHELLLPDPYLPHGVIYRTDPKTRTRRFIPIDLGLIVARTELDQPLMNHDILIVLSLEDIRFLSSERLISVLRKEPAKNPCLALTRLEATVASSDPTRFSNLFQFKETGVTASKGTPDAQLPPPESSDALRLTTATQLQDSTRLKAAIPVAAPTGTEPPSPPCPAIYNKFPDLLPVLLDNSIIIEDNEKNPILFPILPGARMTDIVAVGQGLVGTGKFDKNLSLKFQIDRRRGARDNTRRIIEVPVQDYTTYALQPGDVLNFKIGQVRMIGHVTREQQRTLQSVPTVRHFLLDKDVIKSDPYLLFGMLRRVDPTTRNQTLAAVNLDAILHDIPGSDVTLMDKDELVILSAQDIRFLANPLVQGVLLGKNPRQECQALRHLSDLMSSSDAFRFSSAINLSLSEFEHDKSSAKKAADKNTTMLVTEGPTSRKNECPPIFERYPELLPYALENATILTGEVRTPGVFPILPGTRLASLVQSGGGVTKRADMRHVELSRSHLNTSQGASTSRSVMDFTKSALEEFELTPGDVLRFNPIFSDREIGYVRLEGEFIRSGLYDIRRNDKLSDIMSRAGGITEHAYPFGAIFTRTSIQRTQKENFERVARELEMGLAGLVNSTSKEKGDTNTILENAKGIITSLRAVQPLGRMVVQADPALLKTQPELDIYLEAGDRLFMPKRPSEITVTGAILNPGSFLFVANHSPMDYVKWAGGFKDNANKGDTFVVLPDGKAQAMWSLANWWDQESAALVPGSTIVVPLDPKPFEIMGPIKDVTQILSQWAITIASLSVLSK